MKKFLKTLIYYPLIAVVFFALWATGEWNDDDDRMKKPA